MSKPPSTFETAFDTYTVKGVIGEGGTGRVFLVVDSAGNSYALKCLFPDLSTSQRNRRFRNEINFCAKQSHSNIIRVIDSGAAEWDGTKVPFYVMPYYPATLRNLLDRKIPPTLILPLFAQILDGIEAAHLLKVTHRDLKPENILCDEKGEKLVVADFGIAHFEEEVILTAVETRKADKLANLRYSAPEQRVRGAEVDHRTDIFALGLILNEMYTGTTPQGEGYATVASVAPNASYLDALVSRMIQHAANARPGSIGEIKGELIGRKNAFVARQELDAKRREVVPAAIPGQVAPIRVIGKDWRDGNLIFILDRAPEPAWVARFKNPRENWSSVSGAGPGAFNFVDNVASVRAEEHTIERIVGFINHYLDMATRAYQADLDQEKQRVERAQRDKLAREVEEADRRARILQKLNKS